MEEKEYKDITIEFIESKIYFERQVFISKFKDFIEDDFKLSSKEMEKLKSKIKQLNTLLNG